MTKFLDGPAAGVTLMLHRAPVFLRAVAGTDGTWDALDQLDDEPRPDETVVVYQMVRGPCRWHVQRFVNGRRVCGWYEGGEYQVLAEQPPENVVRVRSAWQGWVQHAGPAAVARLEGVEQR